MKTILVLTDFSIRADHAAHYAVKLAQKIKANVLLCNVFLIPSSSPMASQIAWPMENFETLEQDSADDLSEIVSRLNTRLNIETLTHDEFKPKIDFCSKTGLVADTINDIAKENQVVMVVIGTHAHHGLSSFLSGDHARDIIEKAHCPVLLVPDQVAFKGFKKFAFATDLTQTDIDVLHSLSGLAKHFEAKIMLTHIADESEQNNQGEPRVKIFLGLVSSKINYPNIYYRAVKGKTTPTGLDWLTTHVDFDLLVMVHRKKGFFESLLGGSITQKMADHLTKPLLVFPCSKVADKLPVF
jgi:nucleotide-binding universal stress UspA family protein